VNQSAARWSVNSKGFPLGYRFFIFVIAFGCHSSRNSESRRDHVAQEPRSSDFQTIAAADQFNFNGTVRDLYGPVGFINIELLSDSGRIKGTTSDLTSGVFGFSLTRAEVAELDSIRIAAPGYDTLIDIFNSDRIKDPLTVLN
jgi:hypothetical protein